MERRIQAADIVNQDPAELTRVLVLAHDVRRLQRVYFKNRDRGALDESKAAEKKLDLALTALCQPKGLL